MNGLVSSRSIVPYNNHLLFLSLALHSLRIIYNHLQVDPQIKGYSLCCENVLAHIFTLYLKLHQAPRKIFHRTPAFIGRILTFRWEEKHSTKK